jgi:hypothetical protein
MVRFKEPGGLFPNWSRQSWAITGIWILLVFFCYEVMRQQADRLRHLSEVVAGDIDALHRSLRHSLAIRLQMR